MAQSWIETTTRAATSIDLIKIFSIIFLFHYRSASGFLRCLQCTLHRKTADFSKKTQHVHQATDRIVIKLLKSKPRFLFLKWDRKLNNLTPDIQCIMVVSFLFQVHSQLQCRRNFKTIASKRERVFFYQIILIALAARTHHQNVQQRKCIHSNAMDP